jgi:hypothetical protein
VIRDINIWIWKRSFFGFWIFIFFFILGKWNLGFILTLLTN